MNESDMQSNADLALCEKDHEIDMLRRKLMDDDGRAMQELDAERLKRTLETLDRVQTREADAEDVAFLAAELGVSQWMRKPQRNFNLFQQEMAA